MVIVCPEKSNGIKQRFYYYRSKDLAEWLAKYVQKMGVAGRCEMDKAFTCLVAPDITDYKHLQLTKTQFMREVRAFEKPSEEERIQLQADAYETWKSCLGKCFEKIAEKPEVRVMQWGKRITLDLEKHLELFLSWDTETGEDWLEYLRVARHKLLVRERERENIRKSTRVLVNGKIRIQKSDS